MDDLPSSTGNVAVVTEPPRVSPAAPHEPPAVARRHDGARDRPCDGGFAFARNQAAQRRPMRTEPATPAASGIGVLIVNLGTPDAADTGGGAALSETVPHRPPRDRKRFAVLEDGAQRRHSAIAIAAQSTRLPENLESRQERVAVQDHHAFASRETRRHSRTARQACHRRLGDALRAVRRLHRGSKC